MAKPPKMKNNPWSKFDIPIDKPGELDLSTIKIWYKQVENELWISHVYKSLEEGAGQKISDKLKWSRWAIEKQTKKIKFTPVFPDRSLVIKPENKMKLSHGGRTRIYVRIPIWVRIELINSSSVNILELPTVILSNTWFGTVTKGELCYWISTAARLQIQEDHTRPYLGICPVQLINNSSDDVNIEKLCLHVDGLSLFYNNGQLWSDETKVTYKGAEEISEIEFSARAPREVKNAVLISKPREQAKKGIRAKFFG